MACTSVFQMLVVQGIHGGLDEQSGLMHVLFGVNSCQTNMQCHILSQGSEYVHEMSQCLHLQQRRTKLYNFLFKLSDISN